MCHQFDGNLLVIKFNISKTLSSEVQHQNAGQNHNIKIAYKSFKMQQIQIPGNDRCNLKLN
jgi:hypothetical protein